MAENFNVSGAPTIYFYLNKESGMVDGVYMYSIFGILKREKGKDWAVGSRKDESLREFLSSSEEYEIHSFDWDTDVVTGEDYDAEDDEAWNPIIVQKWGRGEDLTKEDLKPYTRVVPAGEEVNPETAIDGE